MYSPQEEILEELDVLTTPPYSLIVHNDDYNTFDWVIICLITVCNHQQLQAEQSALIVHNNGKCEVKRGSKEAIQEMKDRLLLANLTVSMHALAD
jgi:ATP-dependent Clp protease adaptor protein ClpS